MPKHKELEGIKGIIFDCYNTLIDIKTDDDERRYLQAGK